MKKLRNSIAVIVAIATLTITVSVYAGVFKKGSRTFVADCYTTITPGGSNPITVSLTRGVTKCTIAVAQIGKTGLFGGNMIDPSECVGNSFFCCGRKNSMNVLVAVYCED